MLIRDRDLWRVLQCPHWPYWELFGDPKERRLLSVAQEQMLMGALSQEAAIVTGAFPEIVTLALGGEEEQAKQTEQLMRVGVAAIYHPLLQTEDRVSAPTVLFRVEGPSILGSWQYVALRVKRSHYVRKEDVLLGVFDALVLEKIQGARPVRSWQWSGDQEKFEISIEPAALECEQLISSLEQMMLGERPAPAYRKSCLDTSPWGSLCTALSESTNDIALISNVDRKKLEALRAAGIETVTQMAEADLATIVGTSPLLTARAVDLIQRQAQALEQGTVIIRKSFSDPTNGLEIHFDIESYPPDDRDYLFGFLLVDPLTGKGEKKQFVANDSSQEALMWKEFIGWLKVLPERYTIFHYSPYEVERIQLLATRYGDRNDPMIERCLESCVDLKDSVRDCVIFPLRIYSLKRIGHVLGFHWQGEVHDGAESVEVYARWLKEQDLADLEAICRYNAEDTQATRVLLAWLREYATIEQVYPAKTSWLAISTLLS